MQEQPEEKGGNEAINLERRFLWCRTALKGKSKLLPPVL